MDRAIAKEEEAIAKIEELKARARRSAADRAPRAGTGSLA